MAPRNRYARPRNPVSGSPGAGGGAAVASLVLLTGPATAGSMPPQASAAQSIATQTTAATRVGLNMRSPNRPKAPHSIPPRSARQEQVVRHSRRAANFNAGEWVELWRREEPKKSGRTMKSWRCRDLIPLIGRDFRSREAPYLVAAWGLADASFGRLPKTTESISAMTFRWMISFLSMVICPTPGTFCTFTFSSEPRS